MERGAAGWSVEREGFKKAGENGSKWKGEQGGMGRVIRG